MELGEFVIYDGDLAGKWGCWVNRYYDFGELREAIAKAVDKVAEEACLDRQHPLIAYALLDVLAEPLANLRSHGGVAATAVGRAGLDAHASSLIARRVEVLKSPVSLTVNGVMDRIVDALLVGDQPHATHPEAFESATRYLIEGGVVERTADGDL